MSDWLKNQLFRRGGDLIDGWGWLSGEASALVVNQAVGSTRNRPHPWSSSHSYVTWQGLTDRTHLARHLPPFDAPRQPPEAEVRELFRRPAGQASLSEKSTCLFPAFAQYLTDGFLRTVPGQVHRTSSNHEIDMCPLYGRTPAQTLALRLKDETRGRRGRLKSQMIGDEEFPPFAFKPGTKEASDPEFAKNPEYDANPAFDLRGLDRPLLDEKLPQDRLDTIFAVGGDRVNSTPHTAMMNTLFLREHNRIARHLDDRNPGWNDERVFQTARNVVIPIFIKIVVEDYINHITPLPFALRADPKVAWDAAWNRPNWMTVEFSLLYRWHSLMPDSIAWPAGPASAAHDIPLRAFRQGNRPLLDVGLEAAFVGASAQPAGEVGAMNTADDLLDIEDRAVAQARKNRLDTYNMYRKAFGMREAEEFSDITSDKRIAALLEKLYETPGKVEFYPGLMAEDRIPQSPLPGLLARMVAVDAFSQALTNPLLSEHVWNAETFTAWGFEQIQETSKLAQVVARNVPRRGDGAIAMTQAGWEYGED